MSVKQFRERLSLSIGLDGDYLSGILFLLPYLVAFVVFMAYPLIKGFYISLFHWNPYDPAKSTFVLFDNYAHLARDPLFRKSLVNTVIYSLIYVPSMVVVSLLFALAVNRDIKGKWFMRTVFFIPGILTLSVVALVWLQLYAPSSGPFNYYLSAVWSNPPAWLSSKTFALPAIALTALWAGVGFNLIIFLAARQNIPARLYEAARLDGAGSWRMLVDITVPQMRSSIIFVSITALVNSLQIFDLIYIMTGGGPGYATQTAVLYLYQQAFNDFNTGYAASIGYVIFFLILVISLLNYYVISQYTGSMAGKEA